MRALFALAVFLSAPALAGELELNEVEQRLGIVYVQDRVVLDVHGPAPMFGDVGRSYRHPDYEDDWKRAYCYLTYWRGKLGALRESEKISRKNFKVISKALYRDQQDIIAENEKAYKKAATSRQFLSQLHAGLAERGLDSCRG